MSAPRVEPPVRERWASEERARWYLLERFRTRRSLERDPKQLRALLGRPDVPRSFARALDAPCGTGRLFPALQERAQRAIGADVAPAMLAHARAAARSQDALLAADARALPFADDSFDLVLCCRFLHHQRTDEELLEVLRELVRVTRHLLIASYWDYASLPALRTRAGLKPSETRRAVRRSRMEELVRQAGAEILRQRSAVRWISQQTFFLARKPTAAQASAGR